MFQQELYKYFEDHYKFCSNKLAMCFCKINQNAKTVIMYVTGHDKLSHSVFLKDKWYSVVSIYASGTFLGGRNGCNSDEINDVNEIQSVANIPFSYNGTKDCKKQKLNVKIC